MFSNCGKFSLENSFMVPILREREMRERQRDRKTERQRERVITDNDHGFECY